MSTTVSGGNVRKKHPDKEIEDTVCYAETQGMAGDQMQWTRLGPVALPVSRPGMSLRSVLPNVCLEHAKGHRTSRPGNYDGKLMDVYTSRVN